MTKGKKTERAKRAAAQKLQLTYDKPLSPTSWACHFTPHDPGVPLRCTRLYADAALRGLIERPCVTL
jgi:hypothetical protein